jgi:hypothetical protein
LGITISTTLIVTKRRLGFVQTSFTPFLSQYLIIFSIISVYMHQHTRRRCFTRNPTSIAVCHFFTLWIRSIYSIGSASMYCFLWIVISSYIIIKLSSSSSTLSQLSDSWFKLGLPQRDVDRLEIHIRPNQGISCLTLYVGTVDRTELFN